MICTQFVPTLRNEGMPEKIIENEDELRRLVLVQLARLSVKSEWNGLLGS